jgi:hypothetical protein
MDDPHKLRELASWYREFAERAGNPAIWHARLTTAEELEREADRLERIAARGQVRSRNGTAGRAVAILAFAAGLCVAALATAADEPARPQPTAERGVPTRPTAKPFAPPGLPEFSAGDARVVDELYCQFIGPQLVTPSDSRRPARLRARAAVGGRPSCRSPHGSSRCHRGRAGPAPAG